MSLVSPIYASRLRISPINKQTLSMLLPTPEDFKLRKEAVPQKKKRKKHKNKLKKKKLFVRASKRDVRVSKREKILRKLAQRFGAAVMLQG